MLKARAFAKINLSLDIVGVREDGYHLIRTVMQSISLHDTVSVERVEEGISVTCSDADIPCDRRNIAYRCAEEFFAHTGTKLGVHIDIEKRIPSQAGLGGGSADGAAVLVLLNRLCGSPLSVAELCEIGAQIGADIPFCIVGGCVLCEGIGEVMTPIDSALPLELCIVKPDFGVSTVEAYRRFDALESVSHPDTDSVIRALKTGDRELLCRSLGNVLEFDGRIDEIKSRLVCSGAAAACMSGSGSAVFGIFERGCLPDCNFFDCAVFPASSVPFGVEVLEG